MPRTCNHESTDACLVGGPEPVGLFLPLLGDISCCESCQPRSFHPISITLYSAMSKTQMPVPVPRSSILVCPSFMVIGALCSLFPRAFRKSECPISRWNFSSCSQRLLGKSLGSDHGGAGSLNRKGTGIGICDGFDIHVRSRGRSACVDSCRRWIQ